MTRWKITVEYNGAPYCGWQRQDDMPTVQGAIEDALRKFCQQDITVHVAGRTDAGVHARGQMAHFDLDYAGRTITGMELTKAINAHLRPAPVSVLKAETVGENFHARFSARNKFYRYRIINRTGFLALEQGFTWHIRRALDVEKMQQAANILIGHHDFTTFRDGDCQAKSPEKTLDRMDIITLPCDECGGREIRIEVEGRSFLHHQVRNMVGTLALVGDSKWSVEDVRTALAARDRTKGGPTAPAQGLYLMRVDY